MRKRARIKKDGLFVPIRSQKQQQDKFKKPGLATKSGILVRSKYEQICADFLFNNKIKFSYEPLMLIEGHKFRPDFFLNDHNLFIEICGFNHMPYYRSRVDLKKIYKKGNINALFIDYNGKGSLELIIKEKLEALQII